MKNKIELTRFISFMTIALIKVAQAALLCSSVVFRNERKALLKILKYKVGLLVCIYNEGITESALDVFLFSRRLDFQLIVPTG